MPASLIVKLVIMLLAALCMFVVSGVMLWDDLSLAAIGPALVGVGFLALIFEMIDCHNKKQ